MGSLAERIAAMSKAAPKTNNGTATTASAVVSGGNRLADIKAALAKAKTSNGGRNNLPCGTGWFLLKNGSFKQTEQKARKLSSFSFLCINQIADGENIAGTSPNYSGPRKWEEYEVALFQDGGFLESTMSKNLQALAACMGWSQEYVKQMQSSDQGITMIMELLKGLLCVSLDGTPTNQPCAFANQVVIELHTKATIKDEKSKSDGQPVFDEHGQKKKVTFINTYWNKKVSLTDVLTTLGEVDTVKAFGTAENFEAAFKAEQDLATLAGA